MLDRKIFFAQAKGTAARPGLLGPTLDQGEVDGCDRILDAFDGQPIAFVAYALATAYLETNHTMEPVREAYWLSDTAANKYFFRMYDINGQRPAKARELGNLTPGDGVKYCGMGYPQVTGKANYAKAKAKTGIDFIANPRLMLQPGPAARAMLSGMVEGWFTTRKLGDHLPRDRRATAAEFKPARRVINGMDRAADVARYAVGFQSYLTAAGYRP